MSPSNESRSSGRLAGGWTRTSLVAVAGYTSENALRLLMTAAVGIFLARYLGPEGLGLLSFAGSVFGLLIPFATLGMRGVLVREFSTQDAWRPVLASALSRQLPAALLVSILSAVLVMATRNFERDSVLIALALLPLPVFILGDSFRALLESRGETKRIVSIGLTAAFLTTVMKGGAILLGAPIWVFALAGTAEAGAIAFGMWKGIPGTNTLRGARRNYSPELARRLLRESWPFLVSALAITLYMRADVVMLGLLADDATTGTYVAAARLSEVWYFIPVSAAAAINPRLSRLYVKEDYEGYRLLNQRFMSASFASSALGVLIIVALADILIRFLYGPSFAEAGDVLRIHILAAPFVFIGVASSQWFIDRGKAKEAMVRTAVGAVVNIVLNLVLIPILGGVGAAIATLVAYALSSVLLNGLFVGTRQLFMMQLRSFRLAWH